MSIYVSYTCVHTVEVVLQWYCMGARGRPHCCAFRPCGVRGGFRHSDFVSLFGESKLNFRSERKHCMEVWM